MLVNNVREECFTYLLVIPSVPVGGVIDVPLDLQSDAAFELRAVKTRNLPGMNGFRFRNSLGSLYSSDYISSKVYPTNPGQQPYPQRHGLRLSGGILYPPQGVIRVDVENNTAAPLQNVEVYFFGAKYYEKSTMRPAYPKRMSVMPGLQQLIIRDVPLVGSRQWIPLEVKQDADFVFRGAVCDPFVLGVEGGPVRGTIPTSEVQQLSAVFGNYTNLYAQLFNNDLKPYSNRPLHINELFGQNNPYPAIADGGQDDPAFMRPGLFTPELYVPRLENLYVSVWRNDNTPGMGPIDLYIRFEGAKVIPQ